VSDALLAVEGVGVRLGGATVLRDFGAEVFVVDLVSISFLREFAVLLTAIVLAGRTASAFTAQIGAVPPFSDTRRTNPSRGG